MYTGQRHLIDRWCLATVADAVKLFNVARVHPDNEAEPLEQIAVRCANSAFGHVAATIIGDRNSTAKRYGELCYARFRRLIPEIICESETEEVAH